METVSIEKMRAIAKRIQSAADEYARLASSMETESLESIEVRGFDTLENATLERLESPIGSARRALAKAITAASAKEDVRAAEKLIEENRRKQRTKKGE